MLLILLQQIPWVGSVKACQADTPALVSVDLMQLHDKPACLHRVVAIAQAKHAMSRSFFWASTPSETCVSAHQDVFARVTALSVKDTSCADSAAIVNVL